MTVSITYSSAVSGDAVTEPINEGNVHHGVITTARELCVRHDSIVAITNCKFYLTRVSDSDYAGDFSPMEDLMKLLEWGDATTAGSFGGFQINMDRNGSFPTWSTVTTKSGTGFNVFRTGVGDTRANGITLPTVMGLDTAGIIPAGLSNNISFQMRIQTPSDEDELGIRHVDLLIDFDYTE